MKFQSFMDINTSTSGMQIITISAGGKNLIDRCPAQFAAYKYYKIGNISVKLVPASTLPVDPTGLSYEAGENTVDPRDQLTPGMMRITNGEDIYENLTGITDEQQDALYNNMMLDPRWFKWMLQSGVKRHATPRYWIIGQLHQDKWPGAVMNLPKFDGDGAFVGTRAISQSVDNSNAVVDSAFGSSAHGTVYSSPQGFFQTGHTGVIGWLPTDGFRDIGSTPIPLLASPPECEVMKIILPRARKTEYYYRLYISETVYFREPLVTAFGSPFRPIDVFHTIDVPITHMPTYSDANEVDDTETGGNYGGY